MPEDKINETTTTTTKGIDHREKIFTIRLSNEEWNMIQVLKSKPHYVNIANYVRDSLLHLYQVRTNKAGRVKTGE